MPGATHESGADLRREVGRLQAELEAARQRIRQVEEKAKRRQRAAKEQLQRLTRRQENQQHTISELLERAEEAERRSAALAEALEASDAELRRLRAQVATSVTPAAGTAHATAAQPQAAGASEPGRSAKQTQILSVDRFAKWDAASERVVEVKLGERAVTSGPERRALSPEDLEG